MHTHARWRVLTVACLATGLAGVAEAQPGRGAAKDPAAVQRLAVETGGSPSVHAATGTVRLVRVAPGRAVAAARRADGPSTVAEKEQRALGFLRQHGRAFGVLSPESELTLVGAATDARGQTHLTYVQHYHGLRVFGAAIKVHFDAADALTAVNGALVPDIGVSTAPGRSAEDAARTAATAVRFQTGAASLGTGAPRLLIYREGLVKGVPGESHLAWEVEVGNGADVREFVYVDAQTGKVIDQISGIHEGLNRRAYNAQGATAPGPNYPGNPFWVEGQPLPTGTAEADNMIFASGETYDLFQRAFGRDSFDGLGATMDSIFNRGNGCPNASWNGRFISFCPGTTSDDVTAHEWGHAYTEYTHGLIYQWQSGALNESYSDIWGEVVDFINGRGTDAPGGLRTAGTCTAFTPFPPALRVNSPAAIAGTYSASGAAFGPALTAAGLTADVVLALDGAGVSSTDACEALTNGAAVAGKIAILDRGTCTFVIKVKNAQNAGAIGVIVANNTAGTITMGGADPTITIPSLMISQADGNLVKGQLGVGVNATLRQNAPATLDNSYRWLVGEDATGFGGAIRDMWNPTCYGDPGKVSDTQSYVCSTADSGGVHTNSGIPNHAFALLVDGGTYNGQTVQAIGLTKAAHIYYRAQSVYQTPVSDFADHADALEMSCQDLIGAPLNDLLSGAVSGEVIGAGDCAQVHSATLAVELRTPPTFCNFVPLLAKTPPDRCGPDTTQVNLYANDFESSPDGWSVSHVASTADFTPRDWVWQSNLPGQRPGAAFFGVDPNIGTCAPGGDESGVIYLTSPSITVPASVADPLLTFDHYVATETAWDGGNLKISVDGGPWTLVTTANYTYNAYNRTLNTAGAGNTNPLAGQAAFSGADGGSNAGSWGRSHVRLAAYAAPGSSVRLRWELGTDGCSGGVGWFVDDVTVYTCTSTTAPTITVDDISLTEGHTGFTDGAFTVSLSHPYASPVSVRYSLSEGTARRGVDFVPFDGLMERTIEFAPLTTSVSVPVRVKGDKAREPDETFLLTLSSAVNGVIGDAVGMCTILNDD